MKTVEEQRRDEEKKPRVALTVAKSADGTDQYLENFAKTPAKHAQESKPGSAPANANAFSRLELFTNDEKK